MGPADVFEKIAPGLFFVEAPDNGRFPNCHSLVADGDRTVLIDAGYGIDRVIASTDGWRPDTVLVSHAHPDHVASLWTFADAEILSPLQRSEIFWRYEPMSVRYGGPDYAALWVELVSRMGIKEITADRHFDDGHVIDSGTVTLECLHTPGHVEDHYVFFEPTHGIVYTGDIDLTTFGPWYGQNEADIDLFLDSIQRVADLKPRMLVSSHKGIITDDIPGRLRRYAGVIEQRDERILALVDAPTTVEDLVEKSPIFGGHPFTPDLLRYWEANMITKHLVRLASHDRAIEDRGVWRSI